MPADFTIVEGDTQPVLTDKLTLANGEPAPLEGATIKLVLRSLTSPRPLTLTGVAAIINPKTAAVSYTFAAPDTVGRAGMYQGSWQVTLSGGTPMTFPTVGYLWIAIQESLATPGGQQLVGLPDVKDYLDIDGADRSHDTKLLRFIRGVQPLIEGVTGPIVLQEFEEWFDGGSEVISLTHTPNRGRGTSPVLNLIAASEYRAAAEFPLQIVASPARGSMYSVMLNPRDGTITRRGPAGSTMPFYPGRDSIHAVYQAGQEHVPANVYEATLETVRLNYRSTQSTGKGKRAQADEENAKPLGYFLPQSVHRLLDPTRRHPSIA